ncbi:MAG: hypothetical protein CVU03_12730 [Bacteroidetes bacterium HGW-Bacteroidetes-2]|nr:MAG: hypothetical protein CVU03_12730 [Bacteroidetes bacterium HGW-Bacteroidetes-2]
MNTILKNIKKPNSFSINTKEKVSLNQNLLSIDFLEYKNNIQKQNAKKTTGFNFCFITNSEGIVKYIHPDFLSFLKLENPSIKQNCVLDWIHPEDIAAVIEYIVELIQEKTTNITTEKRFKYKNNVYLNLKWNISFFRNMLYFNIVDTSFFNINEPKNILISSSVKSKLTIQKLEKNFWEKEVASTISEYDKHIFATIAYCTHLE